MVTHAKFMKVPTLTPPFLLCDVNADKVHTIKWPWMIPEGELRLISSWTTSTTLDCPFYTVLFYCMIVTSDLFDWVNQWSQMCYIELQQNTSALVKFFNSFKKKAGRIFELCCSSNILCECLIYCNLFAIPFEFFWAILMHRLGSPVSQTAR